MTDETIRQIWDADVEAFLDHWGGFDGSEDNFQRFLAKPAFDPTLWVIAWDGDEVAGGVDQRHRGRGERGARRQARLAAQRLHAPRVAQAWPGAMR